MNARFVDGFFAIRQRTAQLPSTFFFNYHRHPLPANGILVQFIPPLSNRLGHTLVCWWYFTSIVVRIPCMRRFYTGWRNPRPGSKYKHRAPHCLGLLPAGLMLLTGVSAPTLNVRCSRRQVIEHVPPGGKCGLNSCGFLHLHV